MIIIFQKDKEKGNYIWKCFNSSFSSYHLFRVKDKTAVPSIYSYFCIDIPLLSYWTSYVDANNLVTYGNAFLEVYWKELISFFR